ncbi:hypothetical protein ABPG72_018398 [Tetrahymena utriculariae]
MNSKVFCLLLTFILLQVAYSVDCDFCTYSEDGKQRDGSCTKCEDNTCTPHKATKGTDQSVCISKKCQAGTFSKSGYDLDGNGYGCSNCEPGTQSQVGSTTCNLIPCGYGYYSETGYYNPDEYKNYKCYKCPDGKSTSQEITIGDDDSDKDILCNVQLNQCPEGKRSQDGYDNRNGDGCQDCTTGTYSFKGSKWCNLKPCGYSFYSETGYYNFNKKKSCEYQCPDGKSTEQENSKGNKDDNSVCKVDAKKCPKNKKSKTGYDYDGNGSGCIDCQNGTQSDEGSKSCDLRLCDYGFYSSTGYYNQKLKTKCTACPIGKSTKQQKTEGISDLVCDLELQKCPEGKYSKTGYNGNSKGSQCKFCSYGTSSEVGSTTCNKILCGFGFYSSRGYFYENENDDCKKCPDDKSTSVQNTIGDDERACDVQLKKCPEGKYSFSGYGSDEKGDSCYNCEYDFYSFEGSTKCNLKPCGSGFYSKTGYYDIGKDRQTECKKCPIDKSTSTRNQKGFNDSACDVQLKLCPEGTYSDTGYDSDGNGAYCINCNYDSYSLQGSKECNLKACHYNSYSATGYYDIHTETGCKACPKNTFTQGYKIKGLDNSVCFDYSSSKRSDIHTETDTEATSNQNTTSSIMIQFALSLILLISIF